MVCPKLVVGEFPLSRLSVVLSGPGKHFGGRVFEQHPCGLVAEHGPSSTPPTFATMSKVPTMSIPNMATTPNCFSRPPRCPALPDRAHDPVPASGFARRWANGSRTPASEMRRSMHLSAREMGPFSTAYGSKCRFLKIGIGPLFRWVRGTKGNQLAGGVPNFEKHPYVG